MKQEIAYPYTICCLYTGGSECAREGGKEMGGREGGFFNLHVCTKYVYAHNLVARFQLCFTGTYWSTRPEGRGRRTGKKRATGEKCKHASVCLSIRQSVGSLSVCWPSVCWPSVCWPSVCWPSVCWLSVCLSSFSVMCVTVTIFPRKCVFEDVVV